MIKPKILRAKDSNINTYLDSRNLPFNKIKMITKNNILRVNHYNWWFNNNRTKFIFKTSNKEIIFFWQEIIKFEKKNYLIGGWHSNTKNINIYYIILILKWQLRYNKKNKIKYDWLAVVKKNNAWVLRLIKYLGYKIVNNKRSIYYRAIKKKFSVNEKKFYFLSLKVK